jgi:ABC-type transport system involved in multi-copper enzyme maturation permease subunit
MTTLTDTGRHGTPPLHLDRLLRSERIKMMSTNTWWLFGLGVLVTTGLALLVNIGMADSDLTSPDALATPRAVADEAANIFTSGQYFGGLFVMLFGILLITNEYYHQTATMTFLATPRRTYVIVGKFVTAVLAATVVWVVTTALDLAFGSIFFADTGFASHLGDWTVQRAIVINLLMFALWSVFGIGIGALLRSQIGATVTATLLYTIGAYAALLVFVVIRVYVITTDAVFRGLVVVPSIAAQVAEGSKDLAIPRGQTPSWWVGVLVMLGYGVGMAVIGTVILRRRDVS